MKPFNNITVSSEEPTNNADVWIKYAENMIHNNWRDGFRIGLDGNLFADETYSSTDFIEVKSNTKYIANWELEATQCIGYYTTEKTFISQNTTDNAFITPNNCKYIRASRLTENKNIAKITLFEISDDILVNDDGIYNTIFNTQDYTLNKERKIGKWINGKDLYQKVLKINAPNVTQDGSMIEKTLDLDTDIEEGFIKNAWLKTKVNSLVPLNYTATNGNTIFVFVRTGPPRLVVLSEIQEYSNREIIVVLLYTKKDN